MISLSIVFGRQECILLSRREIVLITSQIRVYFKSKCVLKWIFGQVRGTRSCIRVYGSGALAEKGKKMGLKNMSFLVG